MTTPWVFCSGITPEKNTLPEFWHNWLIDLDEPNRECVTTRPVPVHPSKAPPAAQPLLCHGSQIPDGLQRQIRLETGWFDLFGCSIVVRVCKWKFYLTHIKCMYWDVGKGTVVGRQFFQNLFQLVTTNNYLQYCSSRYSFIKFKQILKYNAREDVNVYKYLQRVLDSSNSQSSLAWSWLPSMSHSSHSTRIC